MVLPHPQATRAPDPWVDPGSAMPKGDFACGAGVRCTLAGVYKEAHVCALLVIQHGRLVHEYYETANRNCHEDAATPGNGADRKYGLKSVTKSVVSSLFGHVWSDPAQFGPLQLDDTVARHVAGLPADSPLGQVTLRQALTMTSALDYDEDSQCIETWTSDHPHDPRGRTFLEAASQYPGRAARRIPGRDFHYSGLNTTLVGLVVEAALARRPGSGPKHLDEALGAWVWQTAGMREPARWKADKADMPNPYCCLYMTARDLGRFGQYILHNWKAGPSDPGAPLHAWTVAAATPHVWPGRRTCTVKGRQVRVGYGYQWWPLSGGEGFTAKGVQGQFLHILPGLDTVVVQFGSRPEGPAADRTARNRAECHVYAAHRFLAEHDWPLPR